MGLTPVKVKIGDFGSDNLYDADFLVDTGTMDSMAPASELEELGSTRLARGNMSWLVAKSGNMSMATQNFGSWTK